MLDTAKSIGKRISSLREQMGLSQEEFAKKLGVHKISVSRYENNIREPLAIHIFEMSRIFGVSMEFILTGHGEPDTTKTHSIIPDGEMERVKMAQKLKPIYPTFDRISDLYFQIWNSHDRQSIGSLELMVENIAARVRPEEEPGASAPGKQRRPRAGGSRGRR